MKRKIFLVAASLCLLASQGFAKENEIQPLTKNIEISPTKKDSREEIKPFDFNKLFADAESYFKAAKAWKVIKCEPKSGFLCTKHECKKRDIKASIILDKKAKTITRCEGENCESFSAEFEQTGVFFNVQSKGPIGTLIRILGDSRYKEITTVGLDAYIANGNCEVVPE